MGDYLRLLTVNDRDIPLATLQRAVPSVAIWSVDHPGVLGNYLAIGPELGLTAERLGDDRAEPRRTQYLGAEEVAEFIDSLDSGGPPSAVRWLNDYLETIRAIYAIRIYPESIAGHPEAEDAVYAVRAALREAVGGIGQWDGHGFTNQDDRLIWCDPSMDLKGITEAAIFDESTGEWVPLSSTSKTPKNCRASSAVRFPSGHKHRIPPKIASRRNALHRRSLRRSLSAQCDRARSRSASPASGDRPSTAFG